MIVIARLFLISLCTSILTSAAFGQTDDSDDDFYVIKSISISDSNCTEYTATAVDISDLSDDPNKFLHNCVKINGFYSTRALFKKESMSHYARAHYSVSLTRNRVGIYGSDKEIKKLQRFEGREVIVTGKMNTCENLGAANTMLFGYCHSNRGPVLILTED